MGEMESRQVPLGLYLDTLEALDEARRAAEAERDALCRMFGQPPEERLLPWEREEAELDE